MNAPPELRLLRYFLAVADELHFGRAARRLHVAQPALSQQIRRLEQALGFPLFERTSRRVALTDAGRSLADTARRTAEELERGLARARRVAAGEAGEITVGYVVPAMLTVLPAVVRRFRARHPDVRVHLRELSSAPQLAALREGGLDAGFVSDPPDDAALDCPRVWTEPLVLALPAEHRLAARRRLTRAAFRDLSADPFLCFPRAQAPEFHERLFGACAAHGLVPDVVQTAPSWHMVVALVGAGLGVGIVPASLRAYRAPHVRYVDLPARFEPARVGLCVRAGAARPAVRAFVDCAAFVSAGGAP